MAGEGNGAGVNYTVKELLAQIWNELVDIKKKLEERTDELEGRINKIDREGSMGTKGDLIDHEARIRALEISGSRLSGAWAAVGIVFGAIAGVAGLIVGVLAYVG